MSKKSKNFGYSTHILTEAMNTLKANISFYQRSARRATNPLHKKTLEKCIETNKDRINEIWFALKLLSENKY